jgi:hypothetical protein
MKEERRASCCDAIITAKTNIETQGDDIKSLKKLYRPVNILSVLFVIFGVAYAIIALGYANIREDVKDVHSKADKVREQHVEEMRDLSDKINDKLDRIMDMIREKE